MARNIARKRTAKSKGQRLKASLSKLSATQGASVRVSATASTKETAMAYIYALGCTLSTEKIDHSLLDDQTDKENIENENIDQSKKFSRIKTGKSLTSNKFANTSDPFYELDDELPERVKSVNASISTEVAPDLTNLALSLSAIG